MSAGPYIQQTMNVSVRTRPSSANSKGQYGGFGRGASIITDSAGIMTHQQPQGSSHWI